MHYKHLPYSTQKKKKKSDFRQPVLHRYAMVTNTGKFGTPMTDLHSFVVKQHIAHWLLTQM